MPAFDMEPPAGKMPSCTTTDFSLLGDFTPGFQHSLEVQGKLGNPCVPQSSKHRDFHGGKEDFMPKKALPCSKRL